MATSSFNIGDLNSDIAALNSKLTTVTQLTASFDPSIATIINSNSRIFAYRYERLLFVLGYIYPTEEITANQTIATVTGVKPLFEVFDSPNGSNGSVSRMKITTYSSTNTGLQNESKLTANAWHSFSFVTIINE